MSLLSNAKWNAFSQVFKIGVQVVNIVYLAKIIPPAEYGILAMALVITNFGILLRDLGTNAALIQRKTLSFELKNTVFWLNVSMGIFLALLICLSSPLIASLYHQPELVPVLLLLSLIFPLSSSASAHLALLERSSEFRRISFIEIFSSLVSVFVAVILAKNGYGVYSLVFQSISINFLSAVMFWRASSFRPSFRCMISINELKNIFSFSANLSLFNFINYFSRNADSFIIGKYMSAAILGSYNLAYRIMLFPLQSLTFVASRSLYPILSKYQDDNVVIQRTYLNCIFVILMITCPLMSGLAIYSVPFINLIFGDKWSQTASILTWLAPTAIIQSVLSTTGSVFTAKGRTSLMMKLGLLGTFLQVGSFLIGVNYSIVTFSKLYLVANVFNFFPIMFFLLAIIDCSFSIFFKKLLPIIISTFVMIGFLFSLNQFLIPLRKIDNVASLLILCFSGAVCYFLCVFLLCKSVRTFVTNKISRISIILKGNS